MSKTKAKQIQPPIESLHKQSKQIRDQEVVNEDENRELRRVTVFYEEMMVTMEAKIASMIDDGLLKLSDADHKLMVTLKEEQKRLHIQKKTKQKELTVLQKSSDFLKMTENKVTECNQIEVEEKEIELEKMKANYDDLKGTIKLPGMIKENDSLRRNIENLNINIAECQKAINECDRSINEGRNNRSDVDILDYEASLGKHTTLNKELAELRKSKRTASKQIENPGESVRDTATEILQNIYELSAGLGISVESEVNYSYSVICNRISARKPSVAKARSPIVSRQQPQKYSVTSSSTSKPQALKRNNFVVNNKPGTADSRYRSSIKSRVPTEPDNRVNKANEGVVEPKTEIVSELAKIVKEDQAVIKIDNGKKSFKEDNEQTDQPKTQPKVSDDKVLNHQNIKKEAKIERNDNNEFNVDGKLESKEVLTKKSEAILQNPENRDHNQPVKQADMKIADTPDQSKAAKAKPDNHDVKTKPVNVLPTSLPDVANIVNKLLIDLALADIDSFSAKKQFINLNFFEVEDRADEFGKAYRKYSKPSDLAELMHQLLEYKDAYNLETVKQQSAIVEYMSFESLAGNYQSSVNATIEQSPDACKSLIDDLCAQRTDNDSIDILSVRDSAAKAGLSSKQSLAIQAVACQKSTGKDLKIKVKDFKKILEKQTIDQAGNKKEPHYPDDDMLDGWDEDFDVKEQITPRDDTMKQGEKENIDDYDDFEEESGNKPFPNPKARTDKDLDDYLDEF